MRAWFAGRVGAIAVALLVAGCETVSWQRPETDTAAMREDLRQCRWYARLEAQRVLSMVPSALARGSAAPVTCRPMGWRSRHSFGDCPMGRTYGFAREPPLFANRVRLEQEFADRCMAARGYRLMPVTE